MLVKIDDSFSMPYPEVICILFEHNRIHLNSKFSFLNNTEVALCEENWKIVKKYELFVEANMN